MVYKYRTIQGKSEGLYKEKGSKFLSFAYPVNSEADVKQQLDNLRKEYFDARHHCYAYILGAEKTKFRANDDGEPNHSAGDPILGQIKSKDLTNVLIVVVRYFGGTKLGVSGLISAYKTAAEEALNNSVIVEVDVVKSIVIRYDYSSTPEIMKLVKEFELGIKDQSFATEGMLHAEYKVAVEDRMNEKLSLLRSLGNKLSWEE
jgi:uncharacterized YigZ family protein